jgi:hypothetical protein
MATFVLIYFVKEVFSDQHDPKFDFWLGISGLAVAYGKFLFCFLMKKGLELLETRELSKYHLVSKTAWLTSTLFIIGAILPWINVFQVLRETYERAPYLFEGKLLIGIVAGLGSQFNSSMTFLLVALSIIFSFKYFEHAITFESEVV